MSEEFDNFFRDKINASQTEVSEDVWKALESHLIKENKKRRFPFGYWYVPVAAVFLISLYPGIHFLTTDGENAATVKSQRSNTLTPAEEIKADVATIQAPASQPFAPIVSSAKQAGIPAPKKHSTEHTVSYHGSDISENSVQQIIQPGEQELSVYNRISVKELPLVNSAVNHLPTAVIHPIIGCPANNSHYEPSLFIEGYVAPAYTIRSLSGGSADFRYRKDSAEKQMFSFGAGIRLSKRISNHMLLKGGIEYLETREKFRLQREDGIRITTVVTVKNVNGVNVYDTISVQETQYRTTHTTNTYRSVSLPIIASYETGNENWRAAFSGGVILNVFSKASGYTLDTAYKAVSMSDNSNGIYKTGVGFSLYGSFALYKNILPNTEVFAEPYFQYQLSNLTTDKAGFNQKMHHLGINLGIRYNLGNLRQRND